MSADPPIDRITTVNQTPDSQTPDRQARDAKGRAAKAAMLSALVIPGAGQIFNREWAKGVFLGLVFLAASLALLIPLGYGAALYALEMHQGNLEQADKAWVFIRENTLNFIFLGVCSVALYIYSIWDAYKRRQALEKAH
jgi:hypothetical protein